MAKTEPNSNAEQYQNFQTLIDRLSENPNVFICAPDESPIKKLRVYAYGGLLCKIPCKNKRGTLNLPDRNYVTKYLSSNRRKEFSKLCDPDGQDDYFEQENFPWPPKDKDKLELFRDRLDFFLEMLKNRSGGHPERATQTAISRNHYDYQTHNCIVCDFEHCIPKSLFANMKSNKPYHNDKKNPTFDMISFSDNEDGPIFTLVELKNQANSCDNLDQHAKDMTAASEYANRKKDYKYTLMLLERLKIMIEHGRLINVRTNIDNLIEHPETVQIKSAFLFVGDCDLNKDKSISKCRELIKSEPLNGFGYQYANTAEDVDLSKMQSWEEFSAQAE